MSSVNRGCIGVCLILFGILLILLYPFFFGKSEVSKNAVESMRIKVFEMALHDYYEKNGRFPANSKELQDYVHPEPLVGSYDNVAEHLALYHDPHTAEQKPWWIIAGAANSKDRGLFVVAPAPSEINGKRCRVVAYSDGTASIADDARCLSQLNGKRIIEIR